MSIKKFGYCLLNISSLTKAFKKKKRKKKKKLKYQSAVTVDVHRQLFYNRNFFNIQNQNQLVDLIELMLTYQPAMIMFWLFSVNFVERQ